jgi:hypothetical protein
MEQGTNEASVNAATEENGKSHQFRFNLHITHYLISSSQLHFVLHEKAIPAESLHNMCTSLLDCPT